MKTIGRSFMISCMMLFSLTASAQRTAEWYQNRIDRFKSLRTIGIVTLSVGVPTTAIGAYFLNHGEQKMEEDDMGSFFEGMDEYFLGNIFVYLGAAEIIGGTVMLIIGNKKMKQYSEKLNGLKLGMYCKPNQAGLTLTYIF